MPVLMMTGEHDRLAPPAEIRGVAGRIWAPPRAPTCGYETIPDAGHVCNVEQPEAYNRHPPRPPGAAAAMTALPRRQQNRMNRERAIWMPR
jgi:hypothetical protein